MNRQIKRLGIFLLVCYVALFLKLNQVQVFQADSLNDNPLNARQAQQDYDRARGSIVSADGQLLAQTIDASGDSQFKHSRIYPQKELFGQITGYLSFRYGATGMEKSYDDQLTGQTLRQQVNGVRDLLVNRPQVGDVHISMRTDVQQVARDQLGPREGSVVALDPRTGEILAFWSFPSFDPNLISQAAPKQEEINKALIGLTAGNPLLAHQYQERYPPGSTFKIVTGSTGLQSGKVTNEAPVYQVATQYLPPQTNVPIKNFGGESCGGALPAILEVSCNSSFAQMGQETIGATDMLNGAQAFGYNQTPPIDLPNAAQSQFPTDVDKNPPKLAQSSIGQNDVAATPLQVALTTGGVANKGIIMTPHVMTEVLDSEGRQVEKYDPQQWLQPLSENAAATMQADMYDVVARGTGTAAQIPGYAVGGKTGTAEVGDSGLIDTWFTAFAGQPGQVPTVAVAVVVLNQPDKGGETTGGVVAAPIAKAVLQKILAVQNTPATAGNAQPSGLPLTPQGNGQPAAGGAGGNGFGPPGVVPTTTR